MTEFKGTPGEWLIEAIPVRKDSRVEVHECEIIASGCYAFGADLVLAPTGDTDRVKQFEADMRLVAAAPDLLRSQTMGQSLNTPDFLDWIAGRLVNEYGVSSNMDFVCSLRERASAGRAAIAKALGDG